MHVLYIMRSHLICDFVYFYDNNNNNV